MDNDLDVTRDAEQEVLVVVSTFTDALVGDDSVERQWQPDLCAWKAMAEPTRDRVGGVSRMADPG